MTDVLALERDEQLDILHAVLRTPPAPAPGVVRLEQLGEILGLQRLPILDDRPRGTQPERATAITRRRAGRDEQDPQGDHVRASLSGRGPPDAVRNFHPACRV